jgi:hypothetical protein
VVVVVVDSVAIGTDGVVVSVETAGANALWYAARIAPQLTQTIAFAAFAAPHFPQTIPSSMHPIPKRASGRSADSSLFGAARGVKESGRVV